MSERNKAAELLGLTKEHECLQTVSVDIQGVLNLREPSGNWKKRFCSVKDGFFIWYSKSVGENMKNFSKLPIDKKPLGIMPLNETLVQVNNFALDGNEIEITHLKLASHPLVLQLRSGSERNEWLQGLEKAQRTTYENAELGAADLEAAKAKGTELQQEKEKVLQELEEQTEKLAKATESKLEILRREKEQSEGFKKQLKLKKDKLQKQEVQKEKLALETEQKEKDLQSLSLQKKQLESKLAMADIALRSIEAEFGQASGRQSVQSLRSRISMPRSSSTNLGVIPRNSERLAKRSEIIVDPNAPPPPLPPLPPHVSKESLQQSVRDLRSFFEGLSAANRSRSTVRTTRMNTYEDSEE